MNFFRKLFASMKITSAEKAQQIAADLQGEHTIASVMADFYVRQLATIDPYEGDAWAFAETKDKRNHMWAEQKRLSRAVDEAEARLAATIQAKR